MTDRIVCQYPEFGSLCGVPLLSNSVWQIQRYPGLPALPVCIRHYIFFEWLQQYDRDMKQAAEILSDVNSASDLVKQ